MARPPTVDVNGLQILNATLEVGNTAEEEDTAASALLLKHEFLDGGADNVTLATLGEVLLEPTLTTLGNFLVRSNSQSSVASASFTVEGFQLEGYAMTLRLEHCAHLHPGAGETLLFRLPVPAGHGLQPGDNVSAPRTTTWASPAPSRPAGSLEHGAPGLLGAAGRNREAALRSLWRVYPGLVLLDTCSLLQPAQFFVKKRSSKKSGCWYDERSVNTPPLVVKFPALAVLLMVRVLPVIPVAKLSRPTLAAR